MLIFLAFLACRPSGGADPSLKDGEGGEPASAGRPAELFVEVAAASGIDFVHRNGMTGEAFIPEIIGPGGAFLDYDNDGDLDVYLVQSGPLGDATVGGAGGDAGAEPMGDRLYRNELGAVAVAGGGEERRLRFTDVTEGAGLRAFGYGMGVATGDYDNDGFIDLYLTNFGPNQLWRNRGDGTFAEVTEEAGAGDERWSVAATFVDYDRDGWLDLYIGNYLDYRLADAPRCQTPLGRRDYCGPLSARPQVDRLLRNLGDGRFEDVSAASGISLGVSNTLGVVAGDFDGDGWLDLYVANDSLPNLLWVNQRDGTFLDDAALSGCAVNAAGRPEASMGVDAGDVDNDGDEDLFMAHLDEETNTLYRNRGDGLFSDATATSGLGLPSFESTGFGTVLFDLDSDGWLDAVVANGAINVIEEQAQAGDRLPLRQRNQLFRNLGDGRFAEITGEAGAGFSEPAVGRGVAVGDVDNDGRMDLLVMNNHGPARLFVNRSRPAAGSADWIGLRLLGGAAAPRDRLGAWVGVYGRGGAARWRRVRTSGSYASAHDPRLIFGLGGLGGLGGDGGPVGDGGIGGGPGAVERIVVRWPDGSWEEHPALVAGRYHAVRQGEGTPLVGGPE